MLCVLMIVSSEWSSCSHFNPSTSRPRAYYDDRIGLKIGCHPHRERAENLDSGHITIVYLCGEGVRLYGTRLKLHEIETFRLLCLSTRVSERIVHFPLRTMHPVDLHGGIMHQPESADLYSSLLCPTSAEHETLCDGVVS